MPDVDTTVYTIFAGMLPTLGFKKGDFAVDRKKGGKAYKTASGATRYGGSHVFTSGGYSTGLGSIIGPTGDLMRGRLRGSVAWFEYSTTIRAIHQELLYTRGGDSTEEEYNRLTQYAEDFYAGRGVGKMKQKSLIDDILRDLGVENLAPTGEEAQGHQGTAEEQAGMGQMATARSGWTQSHPSDDELREAGGLVGSANAIDIYMRGRDGNLYRLDVSKQTMGDKEAHHGLTDLADRQRVTKDRGGVTSEQLMETIEGTGGPQKAQDDLFNYFVNTQEGWNEVIQRLKVYVTSRGTDLDNLDLSDMGQLDAIREDLRRAQKGGGPAGPRGGISAAIPQAQRTDPLSQVRPATREAARRLRRTAVQGVSFHNRSEALQSALSFSLHMLGNIVEFMDHRQGDPGYSTEYKISGNWVAEVKHKIYSTGAQVMEFMPLVKNESVLIHNAASLQEVYQRALFVTHSATADAMVKTQARQQNADHASYIINKGREAVEIGAIVDAGYMNLEHEAYMPTMSGKTVILPETLNEDIDKWIKESGTGSKWRTRVESMLSKHILKGRPLMQREIAGKGGAHVSTAMAQGFQTPVSDSLEARLVGMGVLGENFYFNRGHGRLSLRDDTAGNPMHQAHAQSDVEYQNKQFLGFNPTTTMDTIAMRSMPFNDQRYALLQSETRKKLGLGKGQGHVRGAERIWKELRRWNIKDELDPELAGQLGGLFTDHETGMNIARRPDKAQRMLGRQAAGAYEKDQRWRDRAKGTIGAQGAGFWGLDDYLTNEQHTGWSENVTPYFWAAPYFSILYPSSQVQVSST